MTMIVPPTGERPPKIKTLFQPVEGLNRISLTTDTIREQFKELLNPNQIHKKHSQSLQQNFCT